MALYTQEQIEQANNINLEEYLLRRGEKLKRTGKESRFYYRDSGGEHDSISVSGNRWYDHKNQMGGYPVKFLQEFYGLGFREAVRELLDGDTPVYMRERAGTSCTGKGEKAGFVLPEKADNMKRLFAYLLKTRFLSREVVKAFVDAGLLYQEGKYNNIVFVGTDAEGNPKSASLKSSSSGAKSFRQTVHGSDPHYGFCWRGGGERLFVFEAAVDLLSFLTMYPKDWKEQNYIALDGLSPKAMLRFLQEQGGISEIYPCLDNDPAGIEACDKLMCGRFAEMEGALRQSGGSPDIRNKIAGLERQEQVLAQMLGDGYLDPAFYIPEKNRIQAEREELEAALDTSSGGFSMQEYAEKTEKVIASINHSTKVLGEFDEALFAGIVEKVIVDSQTEVRFCLANGLCIKEEVEAS